MILIYFYAIEPWQYMGPLGLHTECDYVGRMNKIHIGFNPHNLNSPVQPLPTVLKTSVHGKI